MLKKILFINLSAKTGGAEFCLLRLMAALDRNQFEAVLLLPEPGAMQAKAEAMGIETIIFPGLMKFGEPFRCWKIIKIGRAVLVLRKLIRKKNIALLHANSPRAVYAGGLAARLCRIPVITHVRDFHQNPLAARGKSRLIGFLSDRIVTVSQATAAAILEVNPALGRKTEVISDGFDMNMIGAAVCKDIRGEQGWPLESRIIGSVGILHPSKGQNILIRAVARLAGKIPQLKLLLIGEVFHRDAQDYQTVLEKLAAELGISGSVVFTGFRADVLEWIAGLDLFVHPAVIADAFPGVLIEAAALGKPIVATRVGGVPEIVEHEHSALLVGPGEVDSLATAMLSLLNDTGKAERLARQARRRATGLFSIENYVAGICKLYGQLLEGKK